ncbi:MAG: tRNA preQ1(34) S-adenosylmethionine ribosyltransferase-isomerase QueA [Lachnospiraceae bacterium]|nr:tRNA preQ1(34) S-adenosylmethionine ribosyltransferase-isomerase QueA [Lachnospiraceae bacterium]
MKTSDFYFDLPKELIAQDPLTDRSSSRLLVVHRKTGELEHRHFTDIIEYLNPGDCLVINDTKVIPARLIGERLHKTDGPYREPDVPGARIEILLLKRLSDTQWESLVKPGKRCRAGDRVSFGNGKLIAEIKEVLPDGNRIVEFLFDGIFEEILDELGQMPLPPYITHELKDRDRYQTVYAKYSGSAAAPTAGLHFTKELLKKIEEKGIDIAHVTLHVGLGTFRPVKEDDILDHEMHTEWYQVREEDADKMNRAKKSGHRVICVGTTSCRTVESVATADGVMKAQSGETKIFIYPGYRFKEMDALITNFHLPESTLIMLVSAYAGRELTLSAYEEAVRERYRFFSFGDACFFTE